MIYVLWFLSVAILYSPSWYFAGLARSRSVIHRLTFIVAVGAAFLAYVPNRYGLDHWFAPVMVGSGTAVRVVTALGAITPMLVMELLMRHNKLLFTPPVETESVSIVEAAAYRDPAVIVRPRLPSLRHWAYERFPVLFKDALRVQ